MTDSVADLRDELRALLLRIGSEARKTVFMFSDTVALVPGALPVLMDVLKSGCPASLFGDKDKDFVANAMRQQATDAGISDDRCAAILYTSYFILYTVYCILYTLVMAGAPRRSNRATLTYY